MALTLEQIADRVRWGIPLTAPEVGKYLGVAPETVIGWIKTGFLKASNVATGKRPSYRIQPTDLNAFLDIRAEPAKPKNFRVTG
jgi:hypothetical protein